MPKINVNKPNKRVESSIKEKQVEVIKIPLPVLPRPFKEILEKSKFFKKKGIKLKENTNLRDRWLYAQASAPKVNEILKLKEKFPNLSAKKTKNIHNIINGSGKNKLKFLSLSNSHITNLNRVLKNIKSVIMADFVWYNQHSLIITTNKVISSLDLQIIENYIKNVNNMNSNDILTPPIQILFKNNKYSLLDGKY